MSEMNVTDRPIGIFDSGMGGISVLGEAIKQLPNEDFVYFGDSANAPYGEKSVEEIVVLSDNVCAFLLTKQVKAIVIACNTATSAAAALLRTRYPQIPILGMEPALKPAVNLHINGKIVVMATEVTLREKKFADLMLTTSNRAQIIKLPCPNLVRLVERGILNGPEAEIEVRTCFQDIDTSEIGVIVLGCTHFVFLRKVIESIFGDRIRVIDGNEGTIRNLAKTMNKLAINSTNTLKSPCIEIMSSSNENYNAEMKRLLDVYISAPV